MKKISRTFVPLVALVLLAGCGGGGNGGGGGGSGPATHFSVSGPSAAALGSGFQVSVAAQDASNNLVSSYSGTVHFTSSDPHAALPPDTRLNFGGGNVIATLVTTGSQTITVSDITTASLSGTSNSITVNPAGQFPVSSFGAKGDGHTDDTLAIQKAISAAAAAGGGTVVLNVARYFTSGTFVLPQAVTLGGSIEGPFDLGGPNPGMTALAPTLLVTNTAAPFITLQGTGASVSDILFYYPNQVPTSAAAPTVYPFTILMSTGGVKIARVTAANAYNFLDIEIGRVSVQDVFIGAYNNGIYVDHNYDFSTIINVHQDVFWDVLENAAYPTAIDNWVLSHGTALTVTREDALNLQNFFVFSRFTGIALIDSPDTAQGFTAGYGWGSNIQLEAVQYGIILSSSNYPGYKFTNVDIAAAPGLGQAAVQVRPGGLAQPKIEINGVSQRGGWAGGAFPASGPFTIITNILP